MAPAMATRRLREELVKLKTSPPPGVIAEPDESNILKWFFVIRGPADTPYEGGVYIGKLIFPSEYPMKAPSIYVLTPSGRFQINTKICMSMSDFHPESWNPMWSVATIIQGVQSFMASDELTTGGLKASAVDRKKFAKLSMGYNGKNYPHLFDGDIEAALETANQACQKSQEETAQSSGSGQTPASRRRNRRAANRTESSHPEGSEADTTEKGANITNSSGEDQKSLSRRSRRLAKKAASVATDHLNDGMEKINISAEKMNGSAGDEDNDDDRDEEATSTASQNGPSEAEIEKRRRRNAKKRAKQKAKKAAGSAPTEGV